MTPTEDRLQHEQRQQADEILRLTARIEKLELIARTDATAVEFQYLKEEGTEPAAVAIFPILKGEDQ